MKKKVQERNEEEDNKNSRCNMENNNEKESTCRKEMRRKITKTAGARWKTTMKKKVQERNEEEDNKNSRYKRITIPYVNGSSEEIRRRLRGLKYPKIQLQKKNRVC